MNRDVAVGVGGSVVLEGNCRPIELQSPLVIKNFCRNCPGWGGVESEVPALHSRGGGQMFPRVRVGKNGRPNRVQPFVAVGMVKVPMRVDEVLDGLGTNPGESVSDLWASTGKAGIDQQLTVSTGKNRDVPTAAQQNAYIAAELLDRDFIGGVCPSCCFVLVRPLERRGCLEPARPSWWLRWRMQESCDEKRVQLIPCS